jgi:radical SAM protein with 4Fe4S-binding SPASM domain
MRAKISPRITLENRTKLETVIPLDTPYLVFLDPSDVCNLKCDFCPTGNRTLMKQQVGRKQTMMDWNLYRHIIDQFQFFPNKIKTLRLYMMGEPLLNPCFSDMVWYAKQSNYFTKIDTTTNGTLLNEKLSRSIILAGLDKIFVSIPKNYTNVFIENIKYFHSYSSGRCEVFVKIAGDYLTISEQEKFLTDFSEICDSLAIEHTADCWPEFKTENINKSIGIYGQKLPGVAVSVCPYLFYSLTINPNGIVSYCFLDWKQNMQLGDLKTEKISNIWNGEKIRNLRIIMLQGLRNTLSNCKNCNQLLYGMPDNIDKYAMELLKKIL